jgi:hypothetical protein
VVPTLVKLDAVTPDASVAPVNVDALATLAVVANDADVAKLAVPNSEPVIPWDTFNDPVSCVLPDTISPFRAINSFAIIIPNKNVQ